MATKKILKKIIKNGVEYYLPEGGGGGSGLDIGGTSAIVDMKLGDYDSLFSITSGLYKILNAIDTDDEIGLSSGESWSQIVSNATSMSKISHCYAVMCYIANSSVAMNQIVGNSSATKEISECWNSITIIAENKLSSDIYLGSVNGLTYLFTYTTAQDAFFTSAERKTEIISDNIMVIVNNNTLLTNINDDPVVEAVIASSEEAMLAIVASTDKLDIVDENSVIMTGIATNASALTAMSDQNFTSYILEDHDYLVACTSDDDGKARINSMAADDLLPAIFYWTGLSGYSTFADLAANDSAMEIVQSSTEAMLIIQSNAEASSYVKVRYKPNANTKIYLPMDDDLLDHGPNTISVTNNNSVSLVNTYDGSEVPVASFSGASRKLTFTNIDNMSGAWTVSAWINLDSTVNQWVFTQGTSSTNRGLHLGYSEASRGLTFAMYSNDADVGSALGADGTWHNVTWTWDGSTGYCIYVDGVLAKSGTLNSGFYSGNNTGYVGDNSFSTGQQFNGKMSDFFIETGKWNADKVFEYVDKSKGFYGLT